MSIFTDISTYYFCYDMRPHQLSMLNVLSTESAVKPRCPAVVTGTAPGTHDDLIAGKSNPGVFFGGFNALQLKCIHKINDYK